MLSQSTNTEDFWRDVTVGVVQRQRHLLETGTMSDCQFLVGECEPNKRLFFCHKFVLAVASPVFERMFFGELPETTNPIPLPDVDPDSFEILLRYVYTDDFEIPDSLFHQVEEIFYVGQKYMMMDFVDRFISWILESDLKVEHVLPIFGFANLIDNTKLINKCKQLISLHASSLILHSSFHQLEMHEVRNVCEIIKEDITAIQLFDAIGNYALVNGLFESEETSAIVDTTFENEIENPKIDALVNNVFEADIIASSSNNNTIEKEEEVSLSKLDCTLRDLIELVNFDQMTARDFAETAANSKLLNPEEALAILTKLCISQLSN